MMKHMTKWTAGAIIAAMWCLAPAFRHAHDNLLNFLVNSWRNALIRPAAQRALDLSNPLVLLAIALIISVVLIVVELTVANERLRLVSQIALLLAIIVFSAFVFNCLLLFPYRPWS